MLYSTYLYSRSPLSVTATPQKLQAECPRKRFKLIQ